MSAAEDFGSDSDVPEELTAQQGVEQDEEIRRVHKENERRVAQEGKQRRRQRAQRMAEAKSRNEGVADVDIEQKDGEEQTDVPNIPGMLPSNIVNLLAAREKQVFSSDSEEEIVNVKPTKNKKRQKSSGPETVILTNIPQAQCAQNSMEFLKRRKMQVPRSTAVLKNADQALRLLTSKGGLLSRN